MKVINIEGERNTNITTEQPSTAYQPPSIPSQQSEWANEIAIDDANRIVDEKQRKEMLEAIERYKSKRKRTKLFERIVGPTTEEDKKRRVREEEDITALDERLRNLPTVIYLPNGSAEWSQRQERQIWRAQLGLASFSLGPSLATYDNLS